MPPVNGRIPPEFRDGRQVFYSVRRRGTEEYLRISKFNPKTQQPWTGPVSQSWIADSREAAICQAVLLGDDWEVVSWTAWEGNQHDYI